ncbi:MAG: DUF456 domain-containing protein [Acidobacteriota bacterium]
MAGTLLGDWAAWAGPVLLLLVCAAAWVSQVFQLPGNWIMVLAALLYGWLEDFSVVTWWVLALGLLLAGLGEAAEFLAGYLGARRFGGDRWAGAGALAGSVVGALLGAGFGFGLGAIPGTVLGAFAGALSVAAWRERHSGKALWAGLGAALGRTLGLSAKLASGGAFLVLLALRIGWSFAGGRLP